MVTTRKRTLSNQSSSTSSSSASKRPRSRQPALAARPRPRPSQTVAANDDEYNNDLVRRAMEAIQDNSDDLDYVDDGQSPPTTTSASDPTPDSSSDTSESSEELEVPARRNRTPRAPNASGIQSAAEFYARATPATFGIRRTGPILIPDSDDDGNFNAPANVPRVVSLPDSSRSTSESPVRRRPSRLRRATYSQPVARSSVAAAPTTGGTARAAAIPATHRSVRSSRSTSSPSRSVPPPPNNVVSGYETDDERGLARWTTTDEERWFDYWQEGHDSNKEFEIERVLRWRLHKKHHFMEYRVKWKNFRDWSNQWLAGKSLGNCRASVREFWKREANLGRENRGREWTKARDEEVPDEYIATSSDDTEAEVRHANPARRRAARKRKVDDIRRDRYVKEADRILLAAREQAAATSNKPGPSGSRLASTQRGTSVRTSSMRGSGSPSTSRSTPSARPEEEPIPVRDSSDEEDYMHMTQSAGARQEQPRPEPALLSATQARSKSKAPTLPSHSGAQSQGGSSSRPIRPASRTGTVASRPSSSVAQPSIEDPRLVFARQFLPKATARRVRNNGEEGGKVQQDAHSPELPQSAEMPGPLASVHSLYKGAHKRVQPKVHILPDPVRPSVRSTRCETEQASPTRPSPGSDGAGEQDCLAHASTAAASGDACGWGEPDDQSMPTQPSSLWHSSGEMDAVGENSGAGDDFTWNEPDNQPLLEMPTISEAAPADANDSAGGWGWDEPAEAGGETHTSAWQSEPLPSAQQDGLDATQDEHLPTSATENRNHFYNADPATAAPSYDQNGMDANVNDAAAAVTGPYVQQQVDGAVQGDLQMPSAVDEAGAVDTSGGWGDDDEAAVSTHPPTEAAAHASYAIDPSQGQPNHHPRQNDSSQQVREADTVPLAANEEVAGDSATGLGAYSGAVPRGPSLRGRASMAPPDDASNAWGNKRDQPESGPWDNRGGRPESNASFRPHQTYRDRDRPEERPPRWQEGAHRDRRSPSWKANGPLPQQNEYMRQSRQMPSLPSYGNDSGVYLDANQSPQSPVSALQGEPRLADPRRRSYEQPPLSPALSRSYTGSVEEHGDRVAGSNRAVPDPTAPETWRWSEEAFKRICQYYHLFRPTAQGSEEDRWRASLRTFVESNGGGYRLEISVNMRKPSNRVWVWIYDPSQVLNSMQREALKLNNFIFRTYDRRTNQIEDIWPREKPHVVLFSMGALMLRLLRCRDVLPNGTAKEVHDVWRVLPRRTEHHVYHPWQKLAIESIIAAGRLQEYLTSVLDMPQDLLAALEFGMIDIDIEELFFPIRKCSSRFVDPHHEPEDVPDDPLKLPHDLRSLTRDLDKEAKRALLRMQHDMRHSFRTFTLAMAVCSLQPHNLGTSFATLDKEEEIRQIAAKKHALNQSAEYDPFSVAQHGRRPSSQTLSP